MRQEPDLDRTALAAAFRDCWGLDPVDLVYVPEGEYAFCYAFRAAGGTYFAKMWPEPRPGYVSTESTEAILQLTRVLYDRGAFTAQAAPIPTMGGPPFTTHAGRLLAVFPFIEGSRPVESEAFAAALGRSIAALQAATLAVPDLPLRRDTFDIPFAEALPSAFVALGSIGFGDRPGHNAARDLILPYHSGVLDELDRLRVLQAMVRASDPELVICHRDIGTHNIIADEKGRLFFVDWDDAALAPPEHDLFFGRGQWFETMLGSYFDAGGTRALSRSRFAFVHLRRVLDDMSFRLHAILADETGEIDAHEVFGLEEWVVPAWLDRKADFAEMSSAFDRFDLLP